MLAKGGTPFAFEFLKRNLHYYNNNFDKYKTAKADKGEMYEKTFSLNSFNYACLRNGIWIYRLR